MTRFCSFAAVLALALGFSSTTMAQGPLDRISADADVVVRLKAPQETIDQGAALAGAVQVGLGDMVRQQASSVLEMAISVPGLAGVDMSRDWYLVIFTKSTGPPDVFFVIPTTNADQLTGALPDRMTSRVDDDWVVYTETNDEIPAAAESGKGITSVMTDDDADVFKRGNLSLFINVKHLRGVYEDQIAAGKGQVDGLLAQFAAAASQANGMDMEAIMDMYRTMIFGAFQMLDDASSCSAAITINEDGLQIEEYVAFADGSHSSKVIADHPTSALPSLAKLPSNAAVYFGMRGNMRQFIEWGWTMNGRFLNADDEQKEKFNEGMKKMQEMDFGDMVGSFQVGSVAEGMFQYSAIVHATPTEKFRDSMREMTDLLGQIEVAGIKQEMTLELDAESIGAHSIDLLTVKQEIDPNLDPTGMQAEMQEMMFGPDGMVSRIAFLDDFYAQTMGGGRLAMELLLVTIARPPNAKLTEHRQGLIEKSNILMLFDLPKIAVSAITAVSKIPHIPLPIDVDALSKIDLELSYVGFSLAGEPNALRVKTVIPAAQFRGIMTLVNYFRPAQN